MPVLGLLACVVAGWRPTVAAAGATGALVVSLVLDSAGYWDALPVTLLRLLGALGFRLRKVWLLGTVLAAYAGLLAVTDAKRQQRPHRQPTAVVGHGGQNGSQPPGDPRRAGHAAARSCGDRLGSAAADPARHTVACAQAVARKLSDDGYQPVLSIDSATDALASTTQRTLTRIMLQGATNILRYTPAGPRATSPLAVGDCGVRLAITSPLGRGEIYVPDASKSIVQGDSFHATSDTVTGSKSKQLFDSLSAAHSPSVEAGPFLRSGNCDRKCLRT